MTICALCFSAFEARTSYGICPQCYSRDNLHAFDKLQSATKRALRAQVPATLTLPEMLGRISDFQGLCAFCEYHSYADIGLVEPARGLVLSNVVPVCRACSVHMQHSFEQAMTRVRDFLESEPSVERPSLFFDEEIDIVEA